MKQFIMWMCACMCFTGQHSVWMKINCFASKIEPGWTFLPNTLFGQRPVHHQIYKMRVMHFLHLAWTQPSSVWPELRETIWKWFVNSTFAAEIHQRLDESESVQLIFTLALQFSLAQTPFCIISTQLLPLFSSCANFLPSLVLPSLCSDCSLIVGLSKVIIRSISAESLPEETRANYGHK